MALPAALLAGALVIAGAAVIAAMAFAAPVVFAALAPPWLAALVRRWLPLLLGCLRRRLQIVDPVAIRIAWRAVRPIGRSLAA
ncbi:MAG TPA: hypothetical protein VJ890_22165, partial [Vineibacter sp.]|nr:hypothetical protein [Vineibacter sp.]